MYFKKTIFFIITMLIMFVPIQAFAAAVIPDGIFEDWRDKPYLTKAQSTGDPTKDIIQLRWYPNPDDERIYFYLERAEGTEGEKHDKFVDWDIEVFFDSDGLAKKAMIHYHPPSHMVDVDIYDVNSKYLWSAKGKWGDDKDTGERIEFFIPMSYIVGSIQTGYQVNAYFISGNDRFPAEGSITVSTVSTFPIYTVSGAIIIALIITFISRRKAKEVGRD